MAPQPKAYSAAELEELKGILTEEELEGMMDENLVDDPDEDDETDDDSPFKPEAETETVDDDAAGEDDDDQVDDDNDENGDDDDAGTDDDDDDAADPAASDPVDDPALGEDDPAAVDDDGIDDFPFEIPEPPKFDAKAPSAELQARHDELEQQLEELANKHDEGEIMSAEFTRESRKIQKELTPLDLKLSQQTVSAEDARRQAIEHWGGTTVKLFLDKFPDYRATETRLKVLDDVVRKIQMESDDPFHPDVLKKAHKQISKDYGWNFAVAGDEPAPKPEKKPSVPQKRTAPDKGKAREMPPTLGKVPAAEHSDTTDTSKWAQIDRLQGVAYEEAMAGLSDDDQAAYESWLANR